MKMITNSIVVGSSPPQDPPVLFRFASTIMISQYTRKIPESGNRHGVVDVIIITIVIIMTIVVLVITLVVVIIKCSICIGPAHDIRQCFGNRIFLGETTPFVGTGLVPKVFSTDFGISSGGSSSIVVARWLKALANGRVQIKIAIFIDLGQYFLE